MTETHRLPTLLVSGFFGGSLPFLPLERALRRRGIDARRWNSPIMYTGPLAHHADRLICDIIMLHEELGVGVTLVGWSMGGLLALLAALDPEVSYRVRSIIAYGTPLEGTWAAQAGVVTDTIGLTHVLEMTKDSALLRRLRRDIEHAPSAWDFHAINGRFDLLVPGPLRSVPKESRRTGPYMHISPLFDRRLHREIGDLIERP